MSDNEGSPVSAAELPSLSGLLTLAIAVVVVAALYLARDLFVPITLAVLLSFVLAPFVRILRWAGLPRPPAALIAVLLALAVILVVGGVIGAQIASLAQDLPHNWVPGADRGVADGRRGPRRACSRSRRSAAIAASGRAECDGRRWRNGGVLGLVAVRDVGKLSVAGA